MLAQRAALLARGTFRPLLLQQLSSSSRSRAAAAATPSAAAMRRAPISSIGCMRLSSPRLSALEDYYVSGQVATCIQAPMAYYIWFAWSFLMAFVTVGSLLHSNYYFSGKMLPKPSGNTQLLEDSR